MMRQSVMNTRIRAIGETPRRCRQPILRNLTFRVLKHYSKRRVFPSAANISAVIYTVSMDFLVHKRISEQYVEPGRRSFPGTLTVRVEKNQQSTTADNLASSKIQQCKAGSPGYWPRRGGTRSHNIPTDETLEMAEW